MFFSLQSKDMRVGSIDNWRQSECSARKVHAGSVVHSATDALHAGTCHAAQDEQANGDALSSRASVWGENSLPLI